MTTTMTFSFTRDPPKTPMFCPYSDCYSSAFTFLGYLGELAYWRCGECGLDFATLAPTS